MGRKKKALSASGEEKRQKRIQDRLRAVDDRKQKKSTKAAGAKEPAPAPASVPEPAENAAPAPEPVPAQEPAKPERRPKRSYVQPQGRYMGPKQLSIGEPGEDGLRPVGLPPRATVKTLFDAIRKDGFEQDCGVYIRLDMEPVRTSGCHMAYRCLHGVFTRERVPGPAGAMARWEKISLTDILDARIRQLFLADIGGRNVWMASIPMDDYNTEE